MDDRPPVPPVTSGPPVRQVRRADGPSDVAVTTGPVPVRPLGDDDLADEIELYGAVVVAASAKEGELSPEEIDDALGVPAARRGPRTPAQQRRDEDAGGAPRVP